MKSKIDIINETVEYYSKNPRSIVENQYGSFNAGCYYFMPGNPSCMCAVGRCLSVRNSNVRLLKSAAKEHDSLAKIPEELKSGISGDVDELMTYIGNDDCYSLDDALKVAYRGHSLEFWKDLQTLHDYNEFWEGSELTASGRTKVQGLIDEYKGTDTK